MKKVNVVVVGAGAGGGIVAKELAEAGLSVVLLERGKWYTANDCRKDDLRNQRVSVLGNAFGPEDEGNPRVVVATNGRELVVLPSDGAYSNNAACVGGGTLSWGAQAWRYMAQDFRMRSTYGALAGSTLEDWPISYDDLEPFYEKAEWEVGVSGDDSANPFKAPRRRPLPMPPLPPNREYEVLLPAAKRLGLHPFDIPMARNSVPYNGRGPCMRCRWCVGFACEVDAKNGTHNTAIPRALATGNCQLRTGCMTREILVDERGRATGVAYYDENDRLRIQLADFVVVSCAAIESARLLLNSKSRLIRGASGIATTWWDAICKATRTRVRPECSISMCTTTWGRVRASPFPTSITATPASRAAPCWRTNSFACRFMWWAGCRRERRAGAKRTSRLCGITTSARSS